MSNDPNHFILYFNISTTSSNLLTSTGNASDHFWELQKRIKQDKKHPGVLIELRKSTAIWDIAYFVRDQVITLDDLEGFSEDLIDAVKLILSR